MDGTHKIETHFDRLAGGHIGVITELDGDCELYRTRPLTTMEAARRAAARWLFERLKNAALVELAICRGRYSPTLPGPRKPPLVGRC